MMKYVLVLGLVLVVLLGFGVWLWRSASPVPKNLTVQERVDNGVNTNSEIVTVDSVSDNYTLVLVDRSTLDAFLEEMGFWKLVKIDIPGVANNNSPIDRLAIVYSEEKQALNTEDTPEGAIGSVGVEIEDGVMTLTIQSSPLGWVANEKNWHFESQFLRFISDLTVTNKPLEYDASLFDQYSQKPLIFNISEK